jgi:hypothetical protein
MEEAIAFGIKGKTFMHMGDRSFACIERQNMKMADYKPKKIRLREEA